jgi:hypothetical protein
MAVDGCWGPMCDFTGSRTVSNAQPGRCTKTGGYISNAEINELIRKGDGVKQMHDDASNTDVLLYRGMSYYLGILISSLYISFHWNQYLR